MNIKPLLILVVCIFFAMVSCSKEEELIRIDGIWNVTLWEVGGCQDSTLNFSRDLSGLGCNLDTFSNEEKCYNLVFTFDSIDKFSFKLLTDNMTTGMQSESSTNGDYKLITNNRLSLCQLSFCDTLTIIRQGPSMDIVMRTDTLTGCGVHYLAIKE